MSTIVTGATIVTAKPSSGRVFTTERRVRLGDTSPDGLVRLDALARYLQDIARDDSADAKYPKPMAWVVRRSLIEVVKFPKLQEWLMLSTWCSGFGGRWAERSTEIKGDQGGLVNAVTLWVYLDERTGTPCRLSEKFHRVWGESSGGRRVSPRLVLPHDIPVDAARLPWSIRAVDMDAMNHMNNAAHWCALEEAIVALKPDIYELVNVCERAARLPQVPRACLRAELEHIAPVEGQSETILFASQSASSVSAWLTAEGSIATSAKVNASAKVTAT